MGKDGSVGKIIIGTTMVSVIAGAIVPGIVMNKINNDGAGNQPDRNNYALVEHGEMASLNDYLGEKYGATFDDGNTYDNEPDMDFTPRYLFDHQGDENLQADNNIDVAEDHEPTISTSEYVVPTVATPAPTEPAVQTPVPTEKIVRYEKDDYSSHARSVIDSSTIDMSSGETIDIQTGIPSEYADMAARFLTIMDKQECDKYGLYVNFVTSSDVSKYREFARWVETNYGYKMFASISQHDGINDHVDLDVKSMIKYNNGNTPREAQSYLLALRDSVNGIIKKAGIKDGMPTMDVLWKIHKYIIDNFYYDKSMTNYAPGQMLRDGKGVCNAYTILFNTVAKACGIDCDMLLCKKDVNVEHVASLIKIPDGDRPIYMVIDTTMSDSHGDTYMFGMSVTHAVKKYSEKKGYNGYAIIDYTDDASYQNSFLGNMATFSYESSSNTFSSKIGTTQNIDTMIYDIATESDNEMIK